MKRTCKLAEFSAVRRHSAQLRAQDGRAVRGAPLKLARGGLERHERVGACGMPIIAEVAAKHALPSCAHLHLSFWTMSLATTKFTTGG